MVFSIHLSQRIGLEGTVSQIMGLGEYGVQLFMIISGFLLAHSCCKTEAVGKNRVLVRRMLKILPLYYCIILYYFLVHTFVLRNVPEDPTGFGWARYFLLLNTVAPMSGVNFWDNLGITWTIPYFVMAYLLIPPLLKWVNTVNRAAACLVLSLLTKNFVFHLRGWCCPLLGIPFFLEGVFLYFCFREGKKTNAALLFGVLTLGCLGTGTVDAFCYSYLFSLLILGTADMHLQNKLWVKLLEISDRYSYTFYLAHGIVFIHILDRVRWPQAVEAAVAVFGSVLLNWFVHHFAEAKVSRLMSALLLPEKNAN